MGFVAFIAAVALMYFVFASITAYWKCSDEAFFDDYYKHAPSKKSWQPPMNGKPGYLNPKIRFDDKNPKL